jgi:AraC-like DNA-binding protein
VETWLRAELQQMYKTPLFASSDPQETKLQTVQAFKEHELVWNGGKVDSALYRADLGALSFFILRYGAAVHIEPGQLNGFMLFQVPLTGTAQIRVGNRTVAASPRMGAIISPTLSLQLDWNEGCEQMLVKIPRERVEDTCRTLIGHELKSGPIEFHPEMSLDGAVGRGWQYHLGGLLCNHSVAGQSHASPLIHAQEQTLIHHLLLCQPSNYSDHLWRRPAAAPQRKMRAAEDYIRTHLHEPLMLEEIASACGASVRSLCISFREHYQCSPMAYVREARLDAARIALLSATPGSHVTDIALRCGFAHLGRFASSYRARYGETPLQTLRR